MVVPTPASSSSSSSSSSDDSSSTGSSSDEEVEEIEDKGYSKVQSLDDLPSDDSVLLSSSSDDDESDSGKGGTTLRARGSKLEKKRFDNDEQENDSDDNDDDDDESDSSSSDDDEDGNPNEDDHRTNLSLQERLQHDVSREGAIMRRTKQKRAEKQERKVNALQAAKQALLMHKKSKTREQLMDNDDDDNTNDGKDRTQTKVTSSSTAEPKKHRSKHAPAEVSSLRRDNVGHGRFNKTTSMSAGLAVDVRANLYKPLDPRVSSMSGHFDEDNFARNYAFLQEMREKEISQLERQVKSRRTKNGRRRKKYTTTLGQDMEALALLKQQNRQAKQRRVQRDAEKKVKQKIKEQVSKTGKAFFLKKRDKRKLELEARLESMPHAEQQKLLERRRKKNKSRDSKRMRIQES